MHGKATDSVVTKSFPILMNFNILHIIGILFNIDSISNFKKERLLTSLEIDQSCIGTGT